MQIDSLDSADLCFSSNRLRYCTLLPSQVTREYVDWLNDDEVNKYLESRFARHTVDEVREFVERAYRNPAEVLIGVYLKKDGEHIGNVKLGRIDYNHHVGIIGLLIGSKVAWRKGYGTEIISTISRYAFDTIGLRKLEAGAYWSNVGSLMAFKKVGYHLEGIKRGSALLDGKSEDILSLGLLSYELLDG